MFHFVLLCANTITSTWTQQAISINLVLFSDLLCNFPHYSEKMIPKRKNTRIQKKKKQPKTRPILHLKLVINYNYKTFCKVLWFCVFLVDLDLLYKSYKTFFLMADKFSTFSQEKSVIFVRQIMCWLLVAIKVPN